MDQDARKIPSQYKERENRMHNTDMLSNFVMAYNRNYAKVIIVIHLVTMLNTLIMESSHVSSFIYKIYINLG
jgi:hypothetical protein